ncbi:MAG TPA: hypothetical protein VJL86_04580 [Steroidobacteraceae bacterium]|jgi:hypothetical protein|nr:hypothetical protein [Steroidobacteraceae bacterium]
MKRLLLALLAIGVVAVAPAQADSKEMVIEIYRIAPGKHEEFLRQIALYDRANAEAGLPPRQLFVHEGGASWDFLLLQPAHHTEEESAKLDAAFKKLGIPQGAKFFVNFRQLIAEHTDTNVEATTAAEYLKKLE